MKNQKEKLRLEESVEREAVQASCIPRGQK
jgi:hypothetical protein